MVNSFLARSWLFLFSLLSSLMLANILLRPFVELNAPVRVKKLPELPLRFRHDGSFKILQVADMHYGNGAVTRCRDVPPAEASYCSDLNTTQFLERLIAAENPDLIVFTGDNIFGASATDAPESLLKAFKPVKEHKIPWAAILGNHDQESTMTRLELMDFMSSMDYSLSQVNPQGYVINGYGNYHININGPFGSGFVNRSVLNLYLMDSGDREVVNGKKTYSWIKDSQLCWLHNTSQMLQEISPAPALAFFHIPIPEVRDLWYKGYIGSYQEAVTCSTVNSGVLTSLLQMGDVKSVFLGHDHLNDFCGNIRGIWFCYGGGFGYHAYGKAFWPRRGRVISVQLGKTGKEWGQVQLISTWKRLDDQNLSKIDDQVLWRSSSDV
ncbi:purple acid phosphatase 28 isoform X1 [Carex rostrata]